MGSPWVFTAFAPRPPVLAAEKETPFRVIAVVVRVCVSPAPPMSDPGSLPRPGVRAAPGGRGQAEAAAAGGVEKGGGRGRRAGPAEEGGRGAGASRGEGKPPANAGGRGRAQGPGSPPRQPMPRSLRGQARAHVLRRHGSSRRRRRADRFCAHPEFPLRHPDVAVMSLRLPPRPRIGGARLLSQPSHLVRFLDILMSGDDIALTPRLATAFPASVIG